jgi:hypothetical protein
MQIKINPSDTLLSVQKVFEQQYPFLKIEFFKGEHEVGELSADRTKIDVNATFDAITDAPADFSVNISPEITVAEFEQAFRALPNLSLQVYRKSGRVYLETATTDEWTLEEQNSKGEEMAV